MKIRMISDWSDQEYHPKKDTELRVVDKVYSETNSWEVEYYECDWNGKVIAVYPYECEEL